MKLTHAMILAAGLGTRMRPLTDTLPKPLIQVGGKPLIDWCLDWLDAAAIPQVVINSSYRADQLERHLAGRRHPAIALSREGSPPLETGGGVVKALPLLGIGPFLTMNSDAIFPMSPVNATPHDLDIAKPMHPIARMEAAWHEALDFMMLLVPVRQAVGWTGQGDFITDNSGRIRRPQQGEQAEFVFTGVEIMHPRVFAHHPEGAFSLSHFWKQREGAEGWFSNMVAVIHDGPWLNVGDLTGLAAAETYFD